MVQSFESDAGDESGDAMEGGEDPVDAAASEEAEAARKLADEEIIKRGREFFSTTAEAEKSIRKALVEDTEFSTGDQWPDAIKQERDRDGRPCLVINRLPQFIQQVTNDQRQNRPAIKVHPVGDGADVETAKIIQGLARHIEHNSNADVAYDRGFDSATRGGYGYWRVITEYANPNSFDQEILIKSIRDTLSVYFDPRSQEPDGSDANEAGVSEWLERDDFERQYPGSELSSVSGIDALGDIPPDWIKDGSVRVAEYFYRDWIPFKIHRLSTGETVRDEDLQSRLAQAQAAGINARVTQSRVSKEPKVRWIKMNGVEILERCEWAGKYIPIIPAYGAEIYVNGKRTLEGIVRHAKDPQRQLNYMKSAETEAIGLAPRAPFIGVEGQFEGHENEWQTANRRNHAYLQYKPTSLNGQPAPPPQRNAVEPAVQAITIASRGAADDLKATTGIYDPALGAGPADMSGVAIQKRNVQAQTANFHLFDNLTRAIRHTGRILVDLIPHIYDTERSARIIGDDGTQKMVLLNQKHKSESGEEVLYDLDVGIYDVTMDTGPSFASKRQEAAASMADVARAYPQIMQFAGDLFIKNMDWPGAQDIAERIKKTLPPGLAEDPSTPKIPPQVQAMLQQQGQLIQQLSTQLHAASTEIATKRFELEHKERVEMAKITAQIEMKLAELGAQGAVEGLFAEVAALKHQVELAGMGQPIGADAENPSPGASAPEMSPTGGQSPGQPVEQ